MFGIALPGLPPKEVFNTWPLDAQKLAAEFIKLKVLNGIKSYEPKIHRMRFSGNYTYEFIEEKVGKFNRIITNDEFFKKVILKKFNGSDLRICIYPRPPIKSDDFRCMIYKTFDSYETLLKFKDIFPDLKMSKVEYAIDVMCYDPISTGNMLNLLKRYIYFPYKRKTKFYYSDKENCTYYIGNKARNRFFDHDLDKEKDFNLRPQLKIYGWGDNPIKDNKREGWYRDSLHTVRIECIEYRDKIKKTADKLKDFLIDCKFHKTVNNSFKFRKFADTSKRFPKEWEEYLKQDEDGFNNMFQVEYIQNRKRDPNQAIIEPIGFNRLKLNLSYAMRKFDEQWKSS